MPVSYDAFAPHFDAWQRSFGCAYDDLVLPRLVELLARHAAGARRVADLGIGTGDLAIALARRGWDVVGVDCSPGMLVVARQKAADAGVAVTLVDADLRGLRLTPPADVALCVYTVVNQLTADGDLERAFAAVRGALVPGGVFVFETNLPAAYARYWTGEEVVDVGDAVIVRSHHRRSDAPVIEARLSIRRRTGCGFDETSDTIAQRVWSDAEIDAALTAAGFALLEHETYDPFGQPSPTKALWAVRSP